MPRAAPHKCPTKHCAQQGSRDLRPDHPKSRPSSSLRQEKKVHVYGFHTVNTVDVDYSEARNKVVLGRPLSTIFSLVRPLALGIFVKFDGY